MIITSELLRFASLVLAGFFGWEEDGGVVGEVADSGGEGVDGDVVDVGDAVVVGAVIVRTGENVANGGDDAPAVP